MKRSGVLNADLSHALATLGHGDGLLVVDAGYPIPTASWRIDLAIARDLPDLRQVLEVVAADLVVETLVYANEVTDHNPRLAEWLAKKWPDAPRTTIPHAELLASGPSRAKAIVRTGAFEPWGNVLLTSGVDVPKWFEDSTVVVPEYYRERTGRTG